MCHHKNNNNNQDAVGQPAAGMEGLTPPLPTPRTHTTYPSPEKVHIKWHWVEDDDCQIQ